MKHKFVLNIESKGCKECGYDLMSHTKLAYCAVCKEQHDCEIYQDINTRTLCLMCWNCRDTQLQQFKDKVEDARLSNSVILAEAKAIDDSIEVNGDFYNAETVAIADIKTAVWNEHPNLNESEKHFKFQEIIAERVTNFSKAMRNLDDEKFKLAMYKAAAGKTLRDYGADLRESIREQIRINDALYSPPARKPVKIKSDSIPKTTSKTPQERMIESTMKGRNISREEAMETLTKLGLL